MAKANPVLVVDVNGVPVNFGGGGGTPSNTNLSQVNGSAISLGQTSSVNSLPVTLANDQSIGITGTVTASGSVSLLAGSALIGSVNILPATSGGLSLSSTIWVNSGIIIKGSPGQLYHVEAFNNSANIAYLKIYNATSVVAGTGTPVWRYLVPAPAAGGGGGFISIDMQGLAFGTGICAFMTTGIADNDTGAVSSNTCIVNFGYK